jgi:hypothetical protein
MDTSRKNGCGEIADVCLTVIASAQRSNPFFLLAALWIASLRSQ